MCIDDRRKFSILLVVNCVIGMYISLKLPYHSNISKQKGWGGGGSWGRGAGVQDIGGGGAIVLL